MVNSWSIILIVGLAAVAILLYVRMQASSGRTATASRTSDAQVQRTSDQRDYPKEREVSRLAHMSEDDRAWEAATLQRNRDNQARDAELAR